MGVMSKEIKKVKGRDTFLAVQDDLDNFVKAKGYARTEDTNTAFLRQLYYGMETLLNTVAEQDQKIEKLLSDLGKDIVPSRRMSRNVKVRKNAPTPYQELAKAFYLIEKHRDHLGRITWRSVEDPKELVFAYMRKAEAEGININNTMQVQQIPQYRRVFQYVAYNIGAWADVVTEYHTRHVNTLAN
jgi:hypothetical protein